MGGVLTMLTTLFNLVCNTHGNIFEYQGKMFFNIEKFLMEMSEKHYLIVIRHIIEIKVSDF